METVISSQGMMKNNFRGKGGMVMKRKVFLFLAAAAMIAASCLREEMPQPQEEGMYFTFEVAREDLEGSKTVLVEGNKVEWVKNDKVGVYNGK